ncbi:AraC-type DNA-binding protein [Cohnella sp. OV330]|uniref:helix-turn-helix domain-containing protein n=1 Tax=Cohnella sp. OV330 TaxID=1855288 RepID=UPI0008E52FFB|nr:helix-turn-helix domain-containing protein [Cohnella sp. OV330]SFB55836.1 AraC-type DNA-binding protein [Cohnella sp. OV330]
MKPLLRKVQQAAYRAFPRSNYFRRLVWLGCVSVTVPILILGLAYYRYSVNKIEEQFQADSRTSLTILQERTENLMTDIEYQSMQLAANPTIRSWLGRPGFAEQYVIQLNVLDLMNVQKNASSLVQDIVYYASASDTVLSNAYGKTTLADSPEHENIATVLKGARSEGWTYLPAYASNGYISYVRQLPVMRTGRPMGALIYELKAADLGRQLFQSGVAAGEESYAVVDADGTILLHSSDAALLGQRADSVELFRSVLSGSGGEGQFVMGEADGGKVLTATYKTALGRTYISMLPESAIAGQLNWMRLFVLGSVLVILVFGIVLTVASSKFAYSPIDKLILYGRQLRHGPGATGRGNEIGYIRSSLAYLNDQAESLRAYIERIQPDLRDRLVLKLITASAPLKPQAVETEAQAYGMPAAGGFAVLVVRPENLFKEKRFLPSEGPIIVFAVKNVMQELLEGGPFSSGYVLGKEDKEAVAVLRWDAPVREEEAAGMLDVYAGRVCEALKTHLSFTVSVGIGGVRQGLHLLSESYREAEAALQQRLFDENRRVFRYDALPAPSGKLATFNYPKELELEITEHLLQGELGLAEASLDRFYERIRQSESYNTAMHCYHILLSSIIQSLEEMGYGVLDNLGDNLFEQLKARQTYREVQEWFVEFLFPMHRQITEESRANATRIAVQRVCAYIETHQGMPSLIECAEYVSMSPSYLSRLFKQEAGMTFIEYLMKYKVDRAKKLLEETNHSVAEIAELIGYSERNLNRAFQRHLSMSPKQYRMSLR